MAFPVAACWCFDGAAAPAHLVEVEADAEAEQMWWRKKVEEVEVCVHGASE